MTTASLYTGPAGRLLADTHRPEPEGAVAALQSPTRGTAGPAREELHQLITVRLDDARLAEERDR
ncbi:hypothetical protein [Hymenobacter rigui]|uniref:Uncharacterized protein n=1 Tax=Hymenobacter rigui TaxID=334424 RepID=A0A428KU61_9BACT|nr:hypothetical protein [Hymenobacter rigui]RSK50053.1 hypothetical protein EI291_05220 [Hymenobacter rigui]